MSDGMLILLVMSMLVVGCAVAFVIAYGSIGLFCAMGWHRWPRYVNAYTQAPAPIRCERCGAKR